jgi:hypothetical protein
MGLSSTMDNLAACWSVVCSGSLYPPGKTLAEAGVVGVLAVAGLLIYMEYIKYKKDFTLNTYNPLIILCYS